MSLWNCLENIDFASVVGISSNHECEIYEIQNSWMIRGNVGVVGILSDRERKFDEIQDSWTIR